MSGTENPAPHAPLQWWSTASLEALSRRLGALCRDWAVRWEVPFAGAACFNAPDAGPHAPRQWQAWQADPRAATPWAWVGAEPAVPVSLLAPLMFGEGTVGPIASEVADRAWRELGDDVARLLGRAATSALPTFGQARPTAWAGHVRVRLSWARDDAPALWLHLAADSVAPLLRDTQRRWAGQMPRVVDSVPGALAGQRVVLRVELDSTELDLGSLQSLRLGDVLTLSHRLDTPLTLRLPDALAPIACVGYLGARDGRRAVELVRAPDA